MFLLYTFPAILHFIFLFPTCFQYLTFSLPPLSIQGWCCFYLNGNEEERTETSSRFIAGFLGEEDIVQVTSPGSQRPLKQPRPLKFGIVDIYISAKTMVLAKRPLDERQFGTLGVDGVGSLELSLI